MEIEFSPNQLSAARMGVPMKGTAGPSTSTDVAPQGVAELQRALNKVALTRPDKMAALQPQISSLKYPPDQLLNGIAHLLAMHLTQ